MSESEVPQTEAVVEVEAAAEPVAAKSYVEASLMEGLLPQVDDAINQADAAIDKLTKQLNQVQGQKIALLGQRSLLVDLVKQANPVK